MSALTVVQLLPALDAGGVERGTLEIAQALVAAGHRSLVVSAGGRLVPKLKAQGSEHVELAIGAKRPWVLAQVKPLRQLIAAANADVVHARSRLPAWVGKRALAGIARRPAFVTTLHGMNSVSRYSAVMTQGDQVIAVSRACLDYWQQHYPDFDAKAAKVIHRGIDPKEFPHGYQATQTWRQQFFQDYPNAKQGYLLTLPGRLTDWKGQREFIQLIGTLRSQYQRNVHGLIVGGAEASKRRYLQELERQVRESGLGQAVTFTGHRSDVRDIYAISDLVFSLSKRPEAFGRTVVEALALGKPVVAWNHGGAGESLATIYPAGLVPLSDRQALADTTRGLLDNPISVPPKQPFRKSMMQAKTLAIYEQVSAQRAGSGAR